MRLPTIMTLCLALQGCQHHPPAADRAQSRFGAATDCPAVDKSTVEGWLRFRHTLCQLPMKEQRSRLKFLTQATQPLSNEEAVERLLLATCHPELTPGLLREALGSFSINDDMPDAERHLIQMVRDFESGSRALEERNRQLRKKMANTVDGIRDIEAEMDNLHQGKQAP